MIFIYEYDRKWGIFIKIKPDFTQIGQVIKEIRQSLGLHQLDLCRGICSQSQLSKVENGESSPQATTLYMISKRLGIDVNTLFELTTNSRMDYVLEFAAQARDLVRRKEYGKLLEIIQHENNNPVFTKNPYNKQFLLWHEGICAFHYKQEPILALELLKKSLKLTHSIDRYFNEREIEIKNSIGVIYFEIGDYKRAVETYITTLSQLKQYPAQTFDYKIKIRIYYNLAKSLTRLKDFKNANERCHSAIQICIHSESLYLLGELYYHIGYNYFLELNKNKYMYYFNKAISVFELTGQESHIQHIHTMLTPIEMK
jgi:transcriptional regulator with XRE-family HTH domain